MTLLELAGAISIVGGAVLTTHVVLSKLVWKPVKKALVNEMTQELDARLEPILKLVSQLKTNGGSHLADRLVRVEENQIRSEEQRQAINQRVNDIYDLVKSMKETK